MDVLKNFGFECIGHLSDSPDFTLSDYFPISIPKKEFQKEESSIFRIFSGDD